jgi:hypothetical protein
VLIAINPQNIGNIPPGDNLSSALKIKFFTIANSIKIPIFIRLKR